MLEIIELAKQSDLMADGEMWFSPTYGNADVHITDLERFAKLVAEKAFEQGFYAGFKASGEGWNGECPFNVLGLDIQQNESVQHELKESMENYQKGKTD